MRTNPALTHLPAPHAIPGPWTTGRGCYLHLGEAWYPPAPAVVEAIREAAAQAHFYPDSLSHELLAAISAYAGGGVAAVNVIVGNGSDWLIDLVVKAFARPEVRVLSPEPTFFVYAHAARIAGLKVLTGGRRRQARDFRLDASALERVLARHPAIVFLASPNNPTGEPVPREVLLGLLKHRRSLIVLDECYQEFAETNCVDLLAAHPNLLILRSLSKSFALAGLRLGYALGAAPVIDALRKVDQTFSVSRLAQVAGTAALAAPDYYLPRFAETVELRGELAGKLSWRGFRVYPSQANILFAELPAGAPEDLCKRLAARGVYIADFHGKMGIHRAARITVADAKAQARLLKAIDAEL